MQKYAGRGGPEYFFVVNIQVSSVQIVDIDIENFTIVIIENHIFYFTQIPGANAYTLALYYMTRTPLEENPVVHRFVNGDNAYRNSRFKLIPHISKVST